MNNNIPKSDSPRLRTVRELLAELHQLWQRRTNGENVKVPMVTLHMTSGRNISGWLMDAGDLVPGAGVSIQPENEPTEVMCVDFGSIEAVSVRQPKLLNSKRESTAVAPSSQKPAAVVSPKAKVRVSIPPTSERRGPGLPEVSVSDVRRQVMQIESQLSMRLDTSIRIDISWSSIGQNQSALNALQALLAVMNKTMSNLAADPFKKEELRRYFQVIQVQHGVRADVRFDSETLTIAAPLKDGDSGFESATGLHKKISLFL